MCGICGALGLDDAVNIVRRMNQAMVHRGPDSDGFLDAGILALGVRRLRIIDLQGGDQPLHNEDGTVAIFCNGEVYNFQTLRCELESLGHRFTTCSDTEVIVHAYEEWGTGCLSRLRGMFAFAIHDRRESLDGGHGSVAGRVLLARDRLGIKPLYIWHDGRRLLFASEVRALLASGVIPSHLSAAGLYTFLAFGSVQEPLTMLEGITSLAPGSWLQVEMGRDGLELGTGAYWLPAMTGESDPEHSEVRRWLADAVQSHLVSDVPLGAFLSGGLDSGALVALGTDALGAPMHTFTLGFDGWQDDDRGRAALTARRWQSHHQVRVISQKEVLAELPQAIADMDQPTVDGINTWYVARAAKQAGLTVALSGVGGDELFAGYPSFKSVPRLKRLRNAMQWLPRGPLLENALERAVGRTDGRRKLGALLGGEMFFDHPYFAIRALFTPRHVRDILRSETVEQLQGRQAALGLWQESVESQIQFANKYDAVGAVSWLELTQYMRSTLLRDTDSMSMAHSLEVRVPFLDHPLVERILSVKGERKLRRHQPKPLLVDALGDMLPQGVTTAAKRTFTFPFETWLRQELTGVVRGELLHLPDELCSWMSPAVVGHIWSQFEQGRTNWSRPWALFVLSGWVKRNL